MEHHNKDKESRPHNHNRALIGFTTHAGSPKRHAPHAPAYTPSLVWPHKRHARAPTSPRSTGLYVIWGFILSSSGSACASALPPNAGFLPFLIGLGGYERTASHIEAKARAPRGVRPGLYLFAEKNGAHPPAEK